MNLFIPGDDARMRMVKDLSVQRGHQLTTVDKCHAVLLPLPDSASAFPALVSCQGRGRLMLHGRLSNVQQQVLQQHGWQLKDIQADETYVQENALISAEGALAAAMQEVNFTLCGAVCVIVGYGRIAKELARLLRAMGATVRIVARRRKARFNARLHGARAYSISQMEKAFNGAQILFNTVPSQIISTQSLHFLSPKALVMELASPPYGFDLEAARGLGFNVMLASGIPSRYAPSTAARLLMEYLEAGDHHG